MKEYYIVVDEKQKGPFTISQIKALWDRAEITSDTLYSSKGMDGWRPLLELMEEHEEPPSTDNAQPLPDRATETENISDIPPEDDEVLFTGDSYTVTGSRFVTPKETYAIRNITSVRYEVLSANIYFSVFVAIFGVAIVLVSITAGIMSVVGKANANVLFIDVLFLGIIFTAGAVLILFAFKALTRPKTVDVYIVSTAGEIKAVKGMKETPAYKMVKALNTAISKQQ